LIAEADVVSEATGIGYPPFAALWLACLSGQEAEATRLIESTIAEGAARGQGHAVSFAQCVAAILYNSLGRYADALAAAQQASEDTPELYVSMWALPELIEAAVRSGNTQTGSDALERLAETTQAGGTDYGLGIEARSRALLSDDEAADDLYREAIDRLSRTRLRTELARAHLLYGEWLRRQQRRRDARDQLASAYQIFDSAGAAAFADRARIELRAAGGHARQHTVQTPDTLTAQEALIARLAGDGASNPQIAAQLFISRATVAYHLRKVFTKLGVSSRSQLAPAIPARHGAAPPVTPQA